MGKMISKLIVAAALSVGAGGCQSDRTPTPVEPDPLVDVARLTISGGDQQFAPIASTLPLPLSVLATDRQGRPVQNLRISWTSDGAGSLSAPLSVTDINGIASIRRLLGPRAGLNGTAASVEGNPNLKVTFTAIGHVQGATTLAKHPVGSGDFQTDTVRAVLAPYRVLVTNHEGAPVSGITVRWVPVEGTVSAGTSTTDANGVAEVVHTLGSSVGNEQVAARVDGLVGSPAFFVSFAGHGNPAAIRIAAGNNQVGLVGATLADYAVSFSDAHGNVISPTTSSPISWEVTSGGGRVTPVSNQRAIHVLGPEDGPQTVTATAVEMPGRPQVVFAARAASALISVGWADYYYYYYYCYGPPAFGPASVTVAAGKTVAWKWPDACPGYNHNITFEDTPDQPVSSPSQASGSHARTFTRPGTYRYRCTLHSTSFTQGMVGRIIVTDNPSP